MHKPKHFMDLTLDETVLTTPEGALALSDISRAEFVRETASEGHHPSTEQTSAPAVVGGAVIGGALFGGLGALGGGLLGSTVKEEVPGAPKITTLSVKLHFETASTAFSMDIPKDQEMAAYDFAKAVEHAAKKAR